MKTQALPRSFRTLFLKICGGTSAGASVEQLEGRQLLSGDVLTMSEPVTLALPASQNFRPNFVVTADFDGAPGEEIAAFSDNQIRFYSFSDASTVTELSSRRLAYASPGVQPIAFDANGDGAVDLVCGKWLALNDGAGNFANRWSIIAPDRPGTWVRDVVSARLDAGATPDLAVQYFDGAIAFMLGSGTGTFALAATAAITVPSVGGFSFAPLTLQIINNFANTGVDAIVAHDFVAPEYVPTAYTLTANNTLSETPLVAQGGWRIGQVRFADLDADGVTDAYSTSVDTLMYKGLPSGTFAAGSPLFDDLALAAIVDLDNDGRNDLFTRMIMPGIQIRGGGTMGGGPGNGFIALGGQPLNNLLLPRIGPGGFVAFLDIDRDGDRDIVRLGTPAPYGSDFVLLYAEVQTTGPRVSTRPIVIGTPPSPTLSAYEVANLIPPGGRLFSDKSFSLDGITLRDLQIDPSSDDDSVSLADSRFLSSGFETPGNRRRIVVIDADRRGATEYTYTTAASIFIPEGWRNPNTVNQYLPLVNPNDEAVTYSVIIHYASGQRDQVFASGTLAPRSRGSVTLAERGRPSAIRPNEAYSIEVKSSKTIGAALSHYDNLGQPGRGRAMGENLRSQAQSTWIFGDLDTTDLDYVLFFALKPTTITVSFFAENAPTLTQTLSLDTLRRGGLLMRDVPGARPGTSYTARVEASTPMFASLTSYSGESASLSWGQSPPAPLTNWPPTPTVSENVAVRPGLTSTLVLHNTSAEAENLSVTLISNNGPAQVVPISLASGARREIALAPFTTAGTTALGISVTTTALYASLQTTVSVRQRDAVRGDIAASTFRRTEQTRFLFAEGFINPRDRSNAIQDSFQFTNPRRANSESSGDDYVTMRFFLPDGRTAQHTLVVPASSSVIVRTNDIPALTSLRGLGMYATETTVGWGTTVSFTHWDRNQPGAMTFQG